MLKEFFHFLEKEQLPVAGNRTLLAVSGGVDSVAMCYLFREAGLEFGVAHCNFQLRGEASDEDERFVLALARELGIPAYSRRFDTEGYAMDNSLSIQVAARELRYSWLEEVRQENSFTHIATAHHLSDSIETLLYNLTKGCGIRGLHGIPVKNRYIIRPLLFASRGQLERYAAEKRFSYREDATNKELKYQRNKIRHQVIPVLKEVNPAFEHTMAENIEHFRQLEHLLDWAMRHIAQEAILSYGGPFRLSIEVLQSFDSVLPTVLFELLYPYGFNSTQAQQLAQSLHRTGAIFLAPGYRLLVERKELVVEKAAPGKEQEIYELAEDTRELNLPEGVLKMSRKEGRPIAFPDTGREAFLDADVLQFPLLLRHWKAGDVFQPLGMGGRHQKLQDFFSNQKVSRFEKERVWILEDAAGRICWVVGFRIDERFKLKPDSSACFSLKFIKSGRTLKAAGE